MYKENLAHSDCEEGVLRACHRVQRVGITLLPLEVKIETKVLYSCMLTPVVCLHCVDLSINDKVT